MPAQVARKPLPVQVHIRTLPASISDFRFEMKRGQPPATALRDCDSGRSIEWVIVNLTAPSSGSSSSIQRAKPSAFSSGREFVAPFDHKAARRIGFDDLAEAGDPTDWKD
jgi:hypothetical protein